MKNEKEKGEWRPETGDSPSNLQSIKEKTDEARLLETLRLFFNLSNDATEMCQTVRAECCEKRKRYCGRKGYKDGCKKC